MITLENRFFPLRSAACFLIEGGIILLSVVASFQILKDSDALETILLSDALARGIVVAAICQTCMYMLDLYDLKHSQTWGEIFFSLLFALGCVFIGIGTVTYVLPDFAIEGSFYYLTLLLVALLLLAWRVTFDYYLARIAPREKILVVGTGPAARLVAAEIVARQRLGFQLVGLVGEPAAESTDAHREYPLLGGYRDLPDIAHTRGVRRIVVAINERRGLYPTAEMLKLRVSGHNVVEWPVFFERLAGRIPIDDVAPSFFIFNPGFRKSHVLILTRRLISAIIAAAAFVLLAPLFLLVGIAVRLDSPGPIFYSQNRVGQNGRIFRIHKFRSMRPDAERVGGAQWARREDPRITRVGSVIRRLRLDEIPQLYNVLRGDLDIVGPRPERPEFVEELQEMIPYYSLRHTIKPGLTGWAQVMFTYCGTIEESREKLQYDLFYIKNMSVKLDLLILFRTLKIVLLGRGAL